MKRTGGGRFEAPVSNGIDDERYGTSFSWIGRYGKVGKVGRYCGMLQVPVVSLQSAVASNDLVAMDRPPSGRCNVKYMYRQCARHSDT